MMNRRHLFSLLAAGAVMTAEGLWVPGAKKIFLPPKRRWISYVGNYLWWWQAAPHKSPVKAAAYIGPPTPNGFIPLDALQFYQIHEYTENEHGSIAGAYLELTKPFEDGRTMVAPWLTHSLTLNPG